MSRLMRTRYFKLNFFYKQLKSIINMINLKYFELKFPRKIIFKVIDNFI